MMLIFEPGCEAGLCKGITLMFVNWQVVWYGAVWGKIDANDTYKRDWVAYFKKETAQVCS